MRVLAVDTATRSCSVAVAEDETILAELTGGSYQTHVVHLIDMIQTVLQRAGRMLSEIEGFAVGRGPGSFTGLRIGISMIKALAGVTEKPVVGVSDLDALAMQADGGTRMVCPMMDARKGEVYFSRYDTLDGRLRKLMPVRAARPEHAIADIDSDCVFIGEGARIYRKLIMEQVGERASFAAAAQNTIRASTIGLLSMIRFKRLDTDDILRLVPEYIRKSDVELGFGHRGAI